MTQERHTYRLEPPPTINLWPPESHLHGPGRFQVLQQEHKDNVGSLALDDGELNDWATKHPFVWSGFWFCRPAGRYGVMFKTSEKDAPAIVFRMGDTRSLEIFFGVPGLDNVLALPEAGVLHRFYWKDAALRWAIDCNGPVTDTTDVLWS